MASLHTRLTLPTPPQLQQWLAPLERLPLECDGMTQVVSTLLAREGIAHRAVVGSLAVAGVGTIALHWWIELADGWLCDLRARCWLGDDARVPHGVFEPGTAALYTPRQTCDAVVSPVVFWVLAGAPLEAFGRLCEVVDAGAGKG